MVPDSAHDEKNRKKINIFWFRRDLRLTDNRGLYYALKDDLPLLLLFIFDKNILGSLANKSDARVTFIHQCCDALNRSMRQFGSRLEVLHGYPESIFIKLSKSYKIGTVYANHDYEPYARTRDKKIEKLLSRNNIQFKTFKDHVIFEKNQIVNNSGSPFAVFTPYSKRWRKLLLKNDLIPYPSEKLLKNILKATPCAIPDLAKLGFKKSSILIPPNSIKTEVIREYDKIRNFVSLDGTSKLGVHLRFGTVSIRLVVRKALALNQVWLNELIWREFFMMILWHFPQVVDCAYKEKYEAIPWRNNLNDFNRWSLGETGYPIVDAGMRELNQTGFMHNRVRMIAASFLTKHLLIDWRSGAKYFAEKLLDFELASNNGNWQWTAGCGVDAAPYFRIFNPYTQAKKFDPDCKYIKRWVPEFLSEHYPEPMVDHTFARQRALDVYAAALRKQ